MTIVPPLPVVLYAVSATYFAGVMVRLMLTLTPVVCILAAIGFSQLFELYLKDEDSDKNKDGAGGDSEDENSDEHNHKLYDKVKHLFFMKVLLTLNEVNFYGLPRFSLFREWYQFFVTATGEER